MEKDLISILQGFQDKKDITGLDIANLEKDITAFLKEEDKKPDKKPLNNEEEKKIVEIIVALTDIKDIAREHKSKEYYKLTQIRIELIITALKLLYYNNEIRKKEETPNKNYYKMLHSGATNKLTTIKDKKQGKLDEHEGGYKIKEADLTVSIENYEDIIAKLGASTYKLLDVLTIKLTEKNHYKPKEGANINNEVEISIEEYLEMQNKTISKPNKDKQRLLLKNDLQLLYNISIEGKDKNKEFKFRICSGQIKDIKKGIIYFSFSPKLAEYLVKSQIMQYPRAILSINVQLNPNTCFFHRKLALHKGINQNRPQAEIIAVKTLLNCSPEMPSYEDIKDIGGLEQRIIRPFERDLNAIEELEWKYCKSKGLPLTDTEKKQIKDYQFFKDLYIKFNLNNYPEIENNEKTKNEQREKAKQEHRKKRAAARKLD